MNHVDRNGMDPEQMRRVIVSIGKPAPARLALPTLTKREALLLALLAAVMLMGLASAHAMVGSLGVVMQQNLVSPASTGTLAGARGNQEPVQKGSARAQGTWISPLEKLKLEVPAAPPSLKNFLDNFSGPHPVAAPSPVLVLRPYQIDDRQEPEMFGKPGEPGAAVGFLALFCLVVLWLHLRARRYERIHAESAASAKKKRARP